MLPTVNWAYRSKFQWNLHQNTQRFFSGKCSRKCMLSAKCRTCCLGLNMLTHRGWVTHICVGKLGPIGSENGFSPVRRQAISWTNARLLLIEPLGTNFSEILIEIHTFSSKNNCAWKCRLRNGGHLVSASVCQRLLIEYWDSSFNYISCYLYYDTVIFILSRFDLKTQNTTGRWKLLLIYTKHHSIAKAI